jgi:DNA-binding response OmpR family regulator
MPIVLIADDSLSVRKVAERLLKAAGYDVELAANGAEALARLTTLQPDIIIADVIMPDKSGFEVCAHVRSHATLSATPVLLISGVVDDEISRQAVACRADGVVKKPFHGTSLQDRIKALLASRQPPAPPEPTPDETPEPTRIESQKPPPVEMSGPSHVDSPKPEPLVAESAQPASVEILRHVGSTAPEQAEITLGPKVFRITEDQLEKVREVATWAKDVETRLGEEHQRVVELEKQNSVFRETTSTAEARIGALEAALTQAEERLVVLHEQIREAAQAVAGELEAQTSALRDTAASSAARVGEIEGKLADEQKRSAMLEQRIAETEHAASCAQKLAEIFAEIGRLGPKS